jgi:transposase
MLDAKGVRRDQDVIGKDAHDNDAHHALQSLARRVSSTAARSASSTMMARVAPRIAGVERKIHFLAMDLPHSDACFVQAYPAETAEAFCDGHNAAFAFFGKVPRSILYDNTTLAVARILGDGVRQRTRVFSELQFITCLMTGLDRPAKATTKARSRG